MPWRKMKQASVTGCLLDVIANGPSIQMKDRVAGKYYGLHSAPIAGESAVVMALNRRGKMTPTALNEQVVVRHTGSLSCAAGNSGVRGRFVAGGEWFYTTHSVRAVDGARAVALRNGVTPHWLLNEAAPTEATLLRRLHQRLCLQKLHQRLCFHPQALMQGHNALVCDAVQTRAIELAKPPQAVL